MMQKIILSAFSDEYAQAFDTQLEAMEQFGISHIELRHADGKNVSMFQPQDVKEIKAKLEAHGIGVCAIGSPLGKISLSDDMNAHLETARHIFETANCLNTKYIRIFSFYAEKTLTSEEREEKTLAALEKMILLARSYDVTLCHENEALIFGDTPIRCRRLLDYFGGELKCVFDMGNFVLEGVTPYPDAYALLKQDIAYFHIKDALREGAIVPPGRGDAQIRDILTAHKQYAKSDFFATLEPHLQLSSGLNALVGRSFKNPYQYADEKSAFSDAVTQFRALF